jgi:hypothetical protein
MLTLPALRISPFAFILLACAACGGSVASPGGASAPWVAPDNPQVVDVGGPRILQPRVVALVDPTDQDSSAIAPFLGALGQSTYWSQVTGQYGIGPLAAVATVVLPAPIPGDGSQAALETLIAQQAQSYLASHPGASTTIDGRPFVLDTVFVLFTTTAQSCATDAAGHTSLTTPDGTEVAYALVQRCPDPDGQLSPIDHALLLATHELIDASTNPFPSDAPALAHVDDDHLAWTATTDGAFVDTEVAHLCDSGRVTADIGGRSMTLERVWSNAAASAGHGRCAPAVAGTSAELLAVPVLTEHVPFDATRSTRGVTLTKGASTTIDVELFSDFPTPGPWYVEAVDVAVEHGNAPELSLTLDASQGQNGDVLHLTITRLRDPDPSRAAHGVVFELVASPASAFTATHSMYGFVSDGT